MTTRITRNIFIVFALCLVTWLPAQAQAPVGIQVLGAVSTPGQESLGLEVYFVATDGAGRPIQRPDIDSASIQVIGGSQSPAVVGDPNSDIHIVMLMDTSGSMTNVIGAVRDAALSSLEAMPPNARVSVVSFNERPEVMTAFTNDLDGVAAAITRVRVEQAGTCLYDSVWDAIDQLDLEAQRPQDRRAIILFTDGRDQLRADSPDPCSKHTFRDMVNKSQRNPTTPIHTIGLCDSTCRNLNAAELQEMASASGGFSALGGETNLSSMFKEVMEGLNSQLAARANVFAREGENQGVLTLVSRDGGTEISSAPFVFGSDRDYNAPPPAPEITVRGLSYDAKDDAYQIALAIANPQTVDRLVLSLEETDGGKTVREETLNLQGRDTLQTDFSAAGLKTAENYTLFIRAVDSQGFMVERVGDTGFSSNDDKTILASKEFKHEPLEARGVPFQIQSINPDFDAKQLIVDLDMPQTVPGRLIYQGFILDSDTGAKVQEIEPDLLESSQIAIPMAAAIAGIEAPKEFKLALVLETTGDDPQQTASEFPFKLTPPKGKGVVQRITTALQQNPIFLLAIVGFVALFFGLRYMQGKRAGSAASDMRRPPVNRTTGFQALAPKKLHLRVQVLRTPGKQAGNAVTVEKFPFVLGRNEGDLVFDGDTRVSRRHAEISSSGNEFFIQDLKSTNHTYVNDQKLQSGEKVPLKGATRVRLGPDTELQIEQV